MSHDMQSMHDAADEAFVRRIFDALPAMRRRPGDISQTFQGATGRPLARIDEAGIAEPGSDLGGSESAGVKL